VRRATYIALAVTLVAGLLASCGGGGGDGGGPANTAPTADIQASRTYVKETVDVTFNAANSDDAEDGYAGLDVEWDFGHDGQTSDQGVVNHPFPSANTYTVTLTVTDTGGLTDQTTIQITVTAAGAPTTVVDTVTVKGTLTDDSQADDHVDVTVTPPGSVTQASVNGGTGAFGHPVTMGGVPVTVDVYGEDWTGNSDTSQVVITP